MEGPLGLNGGWRGPAGAGSGAGVGGNSAGRDRDRDEEATDGGKGRNLVGMNDRLVWIDCEMTGLDVERDALIEIACLITDAELNLLDEGIDLIIKPPAEALDQMSDVVREMHTTSGLLADLPKGITLAEAAEAVLAYVRKHVSEPRKVPLCGNSIATDRWFIARDMPELDAFLHYRMVDVSSIKELARRWYPRVYFASPAKHGGHRALADITESVQELRYYREALFVPQPGPDSATARVIAARFGNAPPEK
jgi:oligoribonuclease